MNKRVLKLFILFLIISIILFIYVEYLIISTTYNDYKDVKYDYLIILGARVNGDKPSLALKYRLDRALEYINEHGEIKIVVSGSRGDDEDYTESSIMKKYLVSHGVNAENIIEEDRSFSTYQNLKNSYDIVGKSKVLISTNDFHMYRALMVAKKIGFDAQALNAKTPSSIKIIMYLREFVGVILSYFIYK